MENRTSSSLKDPQKTNKQTKKGFLGQFRLSCGHLRGQPTFYNQLYASYEFRAIFGLSGPIMVQNMGSTHLSA